MSSPLVSIVTATYNRSRALAHALESARRSTCTDWELIVVGDACTDDTEAVVRAAGDPRIRFVNLARNTGEQSAANNEGLRLARGRFAAFLNHDDFWAPEHLDTCLAELDRSGAALVFSMALIAVVTGRPEVSGVTPDGAYDPRVFVPASTWVFRRELVDTVGPWRPARGLWTVPSVDWLHRAWRAGVPMRSTGRVTAMLVPSGSRKGSYTGAADTEHERYARLWRDDPRFLERQLALVVEDLARWHLTGTVRHIRRGMINAVRRFLVALRVSPIDAFARLQHRRRGALIDRLRATRGLPPLPREEP